MAAESRSAPGHRLLPDANDLGQVFLGVTFLLCGPVDNFLGLGNRHDACLFLVPDEGDAVEFALLAAHNLGEDGRRVRIGGQFVLLDEVTLIGGFHADML
jgi:hypothetical protein